MSNKCQKCKKCKKRNCTTREYLNESNRLRTILGEKQYKKCCHNPIENSEEKKYRDYSYNGEFHKPLEHNLITGSLVNNLDYEEMKLGILKNDQSLLSSVPLATGSKMKLANPLASLATILIGAPQCALKLVNPPTLSSQAAAAEMVENYSMVLARDVSFINYQSDPIITMLLDNNHMNKEDVLQHLLYKLPGQFEFNSLFRGNDINFNIGPYISQLLLLDAPMGTALMPQIYANPVVKIMPLSPTNRVEWGINKLETINLQNGLPGSPLLPSNIEHKYIYNGRSLSEAVHIDAVYQYYYQAAQILYKLGVKANPGFPAYSNQSSFITGPNLANLLCSLGAVTQLALTHSWYWKWQRFRKLRPEAFGLYVDNIMDSTVENEKNYDISSLLLNNDILSDIFALYGSYTLPQCYPEGSPTHPSYPSGHAAYSGAGITILKIFLDTEHTWSSLPGVTSGLLSKGIVGAIQADSTGSSLIQYNEIDEKDMTVLGEIDKLGFNVSIGRNWAGVHYRSDAIASMELGERIAIKYMEDCLSACVENDINGSVPVISFRKLNGEKYTLKLTVCQ